MNVLIFQSVQELNEVGAGIISSLLQTNPRAILGMATGGTPIGIYEELVRTYSSGKISFKNATAFNLDEYIGLPKDHSESYHTYMYEHLFKHIDIPIEQAYIPDGNALDFAVECKRYDTMIEQVKQIDLQILGIGHNGHIGFNEPAHALIRGTHIVKLSNETRLANARFFEKIDKVPEYAITMGIGTILQAKQILLVAKGADKAEIIYRALTGPITTDIPASLLQTHPHLTVLMTKDAADHFS